VDSLPALTQLDDLDEVRARIATTGDLVHCALQGLDLRDLTETLLTVEVTGAVFMGCTVTPEALGRLQAERVLFFPPFDGLPFRAFRGSLYGPEELFAEYEPGRPETLDAALDTRVYRWHRAALARNDVVDQLAQRIHDHAIDDAVTELLGTGRRSHVVAVMGGHGMRRDDPMYRAVAHLTRRLTAAGCFCASGGGPGAMEATNLGAWFGGRSEAELDAAIEVLSAAATYQPEAAWLDAAFAVRARWPLPDGAAGSLGVPTWHYGHEPPNVFATHIAKYFANSIREDGLLAMALGGVVFAPGSAGTIQEIFQDAAQNHYRSFGDPSPMVFFGRRYWTEEKPVYPLLAGLAAGHDYGELIAIADTVDEVIAALARRVNRGVGPAPHDS
jgi:predicted Rossmann-fold nucleotide-binding protein